MLSVAGESFIRFRLMPPEYSTFHGHFGGFAVSSSSSPTFFFTHESPPSILSFPLTLRLKLTPHSLSKSISNMRWLLFNTCIKSARLAKLLAMEGSKAGLVKELPLGLDATMEEEHNLMSNLTTEEEYTSMSNLLEEFSSISNIDKAWTFKSDSGLDSQAMFLISQPSLLGNKRRKFIMSSHISKESRTCVKLQWVPFPVEMSGVSTIVPSPSGAKLLVVRDTDNKSPTQIEIWSPSQLEKEFHIPKSVHGSIYTDGWFQGISWTSDETLVAYVAEAPTPPKPTFCSQGNNKGGSTDKALSGWKGQGDLEDDWGESYTGKRQPALFVINTNSGEVQAVKGIEKSLSVGQVVWDPSDRYLVFVGWLSETRKLGIKVCYNRPSALYVARAPSFESEANAHDHEDNSSEDMPAVNLTHQSISSAVFPRFSPDGMFLVFLSGRSSVESGAHSCTKSLHRIEWPMKAKLLSFVKIVDVVPVVMSPEDGCFPGLYTPSVLSNPWLSDGHTMILPSVWGSRQVILSVNVLSAQVLRISPVDSDFSWNVLALDGDNVFAVSSSPVDVPQIKYGYLVDKATKADAWRWLNVSSPIYRCPEKVRSLLSTLQFSIINVPVKDVSDSPTKGDSKPFEAILVSSSTKRNDTDDPLIVYLHGGPHSISLSNFSKPLAFLCSIGYNMLIVNYRGSLGFGEESLRSLTGKFGSQDVNDVLTAIDHVIDMGHTNPSKIALFGGSHGGFLTTHLIGQAPDRFAAAAVKNPVCNLALMVCTADIPDWCYVGAYGSEGKNIFTEAPTAEQLNDFYRKSPISHVSKVKTPTLFLLGADDRRVPYYNGLQYARALKERGVDCKIIVFPNHGHAIRRPQSDFECYINIAVWFKNYSK